ncbi:MAG: hypothetical protein ACLP1X_01325 [Polyangiaceae bacterium]
MNDPDDTEPAGRPDECAEGTDPEQETDDTLLDTPEEEDTDAFLRWLPTMWLGHRRRKELVERPSSDGASFAAYACEGRPAPASMRLQPEATVQVQPIPAAGSRPPARRGVAYDSGSRERDAPTVVTRRRTGARAALIGWSAVGVVAVSAVVGGWTHRPLRGEAAASGSAAATPPVQFAASESKPREPLQTAPAAAAFESNAERPPANASIAKTPARPKALASLPSSAARKKDSVGGAPVGIDAVARNRTPLGVPSSVPSKEEFFEAP